VTLQDIIVYDVVGEDANGRLMGRHRSTGICRPRFLERARYYGEDQRLVAALEAAQTSE
jgi:pilus assembly protein CpaF